MAHTVAVENTFRGPMDLLLHLVKREEIDIHDIPIARLTKAYIAEIDKLSDLDVDIASEFMTVASMLVEIKSRMLLPPIEVEEGMEEDENLDPRVGLVQALLEYKRFKEAATALGEMAEEHRQRFSRIAPKFSLENDQEATIEDAGVLDLLVAFQRLAKALLTSTSSREIINDEKPTEFRMRQIEEVIAATGRTRFSLLLSSQPTKGEMVGFFIALMELIRLRKVTARQASDYADILIEKQTAAEVTPTGQRKTSPPHTCRHFASLFPPLSPRAATKPIFRRPVTLFGKPPSQREPRTLRSHKGLF